MSAVLGLALGVGLLLIVSPGLTRGRVAGRSVGPDRMRAWLARAGWERVDPGVFVVTSAVVGVVVGAVVAAVLPVVAVAGIAAAAGMLLPAVVVRGRGRRRARVVRAAWPDLVDHLVASIRSGRSLAEAIAGLGDVGPPGLRESFREFERLVDAIGTLEPALDDLKRRLADPAADRILETIRMARDVGGTELPAVLRALAAGLRQDAAVRSEIEARQSWVVNAARLGVASPWIVLVLLGSRPETAAAYNSSAGLALLTVGFVVTVVAYRVMLILGRLPEERRWFA